MKAGTNLEKVLESGKFAVTAEAGPPKGTSAEVIQEHGELLRHCCEAVNVTDNQTAVVRMSSFAGCALLRQQGIEPVMQMVTRDRNRIALQSDILSAAAFGIENLLLLTGDHTSLGDHKDAKPVFDLDSVQLLRMIRTMESGADIAGNELNGAPKFCIGASVHPETDFIEPQLIICFWP